MSARKIKVLFFAEGATLAHVARPYLLARTLDDPFEVSFARPKNFSWLTADAPFRTLDLDCQDAAVFAQRLERGAPLYDRETLQRYLQADLALIDALAPDVVVGDFRISLSVSARLRARPYITICDAYWSPERTLAPPLPVLSFTRFAPLRLTNGIFRRVAPLAMRVHTRPLEHLRASHGLPGLGHDIRQCYTDADLRLFANFPALFPEVQPSSKAAFIGPIFWSPTPKESWTVERRDRPLVYVTMGSSGRTHVLESIVSALEACGCDIILASAGKDLPRAVTSSSARVFDYVPGDLVCEAANLVICNGGSPTTNQALSHGVPVLGIAWNMDQFLNMQTIAAFGAGILMRGDRVTQSGTLEAVTRLLAESHYRMQAQALRTSWYAVAAHAGLGGHILSLLQHDR